MILDMLVGLLRGMGPSQGLYLHIKTRTYIHASSEIRTHDPNVPAVQWNTRLRARGLWDRPSFLIKMPYSHLVLAVWAVGYGSVDTADATVSTELKVMGEFKRQRKAHLHSA